MEFRTVKASLVPTEERAAAEGAPSPAHEEFVSRFQPQSPEDKLHDALSYGRTPIGPAPKPAPSKGTVPSPGIIIPRNKE